MMKITINRPACAASLLADPTFCANWANLCCRCPWSTTYQLPAFVAVWYRIYAENFEPLLVTARYEDSALTGILCLAMSRKDGRVVFAGESQAEYQTWVCEPELANRFAVGALLALRAMFPDATLEFRYLPPLVPLDWLADPRVEGLTLLTANRRPLIRFAAISKDPLAKPNNKKRLKKLQNQGELNFGRVSEVAELESIFDDLAGFHDLRHMAMYGIAPFAGDALRKSFWLELMKSPGLLHVTALRAGDQLASVHINVCDGKQLHLHLFAHNPLLAKHSPGKFHIHFLSQMLMAEGYESIDLTPGDDPYKNRFANAGDTAHVLSFFTTRREKAKKFAAIHLKQAARMALNAMHIHPARAEAAWQSATELPPNKMLPALLAPIAVRIHSRPRLTTYVAAIEQTESSNGSHTHFNVDDTRDLMAYCPEPGEVSRRRFLSAALKAIEEGQHFYSYTENDRLLQIGWIIEKPSDLFLSRFPAGLNLPPNHALIIDLQAFCPPREAELTAACIKSMLADLRCRGAVGAAMIARVDQSQAVRLLEAAGFRCPTGSLK